MHLCMLGVWCINISVKIQSLDSYFSYMSLTGAENQGHSFKYIVYGWKFFLHTRDDFRG